MSDHPLVSTARVNVDPKRDAFKIRVLILLFVCVTLTAAPAKPPLALKFTVRKHQSIDIDEKGVRTILSLAGRVLNEACKKAEHSKSGKKFKKSWCGDIDFQLNGELSVMPPLDESALRANKYSDLAIQAAKLSESSGLYGRDAVRGVMLSAKSADGLQIHIVPSIVAPCPDFSVAPAKRRLGPEDLHPWLGCAEIHGHSAVLRPIVTMLGPKDKEWYEREAVLWAHEIAHLLGLDDLDPDLLSALLSALPRGIPGWLMAHPNKKESQGLLAEECDVIMHYPKNEMQCINIEVFFKQLAKSKQTVAGQ